MEWFRPETFRLGCVLGKMPRVDPRRLKHDGCRPNMGQEQDCLAAIVFLIPWSYYVQVVMFAFLHCSLMDDVKIKTIGLAQML